MWILDLFKAGGKAKSVQTKQFAQHPFEGWFGYTPLSTPDKKLYEAMREGIPLIDAAVDKIIRLMGGFEVHCSDRKKQAILDDFVKNVRVGGSSKGLRQFVAIYLDSLLTYGNAVGEIVLDEKQREILGLYNADIDSVHIKPTKDNLSVEIYTLDENRNYRPLKRPELVLFTPLNPPAGEIRGVSLLRSLPFVSSILIKIFNSIDNNFERVGNLKYAVTYKPGSSAVDRAHAKEIVNDIAEQWSDVMSSQKNGVVKDFVSVGDVDIKVIGADNQFIDTEVPVRQILEQIVAKLGIPPFMLGLHWSTTERMSALQADILTSELESYRSLVESVIIKICEICLRLNGSGSGVRVEWENINLQDELEEANVRLLNAQAVKMELENGGEAGETDEGL